MSLRTILPGRTIGILGGGQLGRMLALAGSAMGYRFHVFDPQETCSAGYVVEKSQKNADYSNKKALKSFAKSVDLVTLEFENIPLDALEAVAEVTPILPGRHILEICQDREKEKTFLSKYGFPCTPFILVQSAENLDAAVKHIGTPCVLKTTRMGYDGKGQIRIRDESHFNALRVWNDLNAKTAILEKWVDFAAEYSVICCRNIRGEMTVFPMGENQHANGILAKTIVPARIHKSIEEEAYALAKEITEKLEVVGTLAIEFFLDRERKWLVNELAPRPHNSGHYTIDACATSQFEQHIRAICGLPLGSTQLLRPVVMTNLMGDLWKHGEPDWPELLKNPDIKLHLYDKGQPKPGRKMGHFCLFSDRLTSPNFAN